MNKAKDATFTRMNFILAVAVGIVMACSSNPALAEQTITASRPFHVSFETQPVSLLLNLVPGSHAVNGSVEIPLGQHVAAFGGVSVMRVNLSDEMVAKVQDASNADDSIARASRSNLVQGGARYYGNTYGDSWFVGGQFGVGSEDTTWLRDGEEIADKSQVYTSGLDAGYRWLWNSGFLMRVGAGVNAVNQRARTISALNTAAVSDDATDAIAKKGQTQKTTIRTALDFGMGWAF